MLLQDKENKLIKLLITIDDFCIALDKWKESKPVFNRKLTNKPTLSESEMLTIVVFYQLSGYKCFQYYYHSLVATTLKPYFPHQISYE